MSELVTVYPLRGAIPYKGFTFSVTLRQSTSADPQDAPIGSMAVAILLMDDFVEAHEAGIIDLSLFRVYDQADQRPPQEQRASVSQSARPPQEQRPQASADHPRPVNEGDIGIERIVEVKKMSHPDTGEPFLGLFTMYGPNVGKFPEYKIGFTKDTDKDFLSDISVNTGVDWTTQPIGTKIGKPFNVQYALGKLKSGGNGQNRWHNLRAVLIGGNERKPQNETPEDGSGIPW